MSDAIAVFHGAFGRVCLYLMDRKMAPHGHREGHLVFHVSGPPGQMVIDDQAYPISPTQAVAVSPWQAHYYEPITEKEPMLALVLYIRPGWFLEAARQVTASMRFGRNGVEVTDHLVRLVSETAHVMLDHDQLDPLLEDRLCTLTQAAYDQSWQWTERGAAFTGPHPCGRDYRIRNAIKLMQSAIGNELALNHIAREVGLSRPHFYKLFRAQVGLTPNLYLNALRMERAIEALSATEAPVSDIGYDLGFSSQASFSRFFISNGVVPPSSYRRSVQSLETALG